jgi:hypothetical protein
MNRGFVQSTVTLPKRRRKVQYFTIELIDSYASQVLRFRTINWKAEIRFDGNTAFVGFVRRKRIRIATASHLGLTTATGIIHAN